MTCNVSRYIDEQILSCMRCADVANRATEAERQWLIVLNALLGARKDVCRDCSKCGKEAA